MSKQLISHLKKEAQNLKNEGLFKEEYSILSPQSSHIQVEKKGEMLNFCANNYLGLANNPELIEAGKSGLARYGFGLSSVRFICGTLDIHKKLENRLSQFLQTEDTLLYSSCFDANGGLFETILGSEDAIISDELNHASIIDGIRLCKAQRYRYKNNDMKDLEAKLKETQSARFRLIASDAVFSMDGIIANLEVICQLAETYDALVMIDDCHGVGFMGEKGGGTHIHCGVANKIDIITGTLGKALGGASGGYTSGRKEIISMLRQRSRPYLFSNAICPAITFASLKVLDLLESTQDLRNKLFFNTKYFREEMEQLGFNVIKGTHPIVPIMFGEEKIAKAFAEEMLKEGIYVIPFSYPVVPKGKARIRVQISAAHTIEDLDRALEAFKKVETTMRAK